MNSEKTITVDPMAAINLLSAEKEFYRNRCLLLENEIVLLRKSSNSDMTRAIDIAKES